MRKDPHADFSYRIIKTEPPQLVLAVADTEEDILLTWAALQRYFLGRLTTEIQATDWTSVGTRILEKESNDVVEGWVDVPTNHLQQGHPEIDEIVEKFGFVLGPFVPLASHMHHTVGWGDPYRSIACLIILWNAWSHDVLIELTLLIFAFTLAYIHCHEPQSRPSDQLRLALEAIRAFTYILECIRRLAYAFAAASCAACILWLMARHSLIMLGPSALSTTLFLLVVALFAICLLLPSQPPAEVKISIAKPADCPPASPTSPAVSQATETGSPLFDDGNMSMQSALQADLRPPALRALPPGLVAPSCELPDSARRIFILANSDGWQTVSSSDGVLYESKSVPWASNKAARFTTTILCTLTELYDFLTNADQLRKLDPLMTKMERLSTAEETEVSLVYNAYSMFKPPVIGVSKRDFVTEISNLFLLATEEGVVRVTSREGVDSHERSVLVQGSCSVEDDQRPPVKGAVRGVNFAFGYLVRRASSGVRLTQVMSIDPRGWLPSAAIDASNSVQIEKLLKLRKLLSKVPG
eukprot:GGOE01001807.1.p1 GENE.GGOE01001807.1~~GGOE01001807.1.p1  ORF type:complete len:584 (+),score=124.83 GGOE01001807.1:173-1753(+)